LPPLALPLPPLPPLPLPLPLPLIIYNSFNTNKHYCSKCF